MGDALVPGPPPARFWPDFFWRLFGRFFALVLLCSLLCVSDFLPGLLVSAGHVQKRFELFIPIRILSGGRVCAGVYRQYVGQTGVLFVLPNHDVKTLPNECVRIPHVVDKGVDEFVLFDTLGVQPGNLLSQEAVLPGEGIHHDSISPKII